MHSERNLSIARFRTQSNHFRIRLHQEESIFGIFQDFKINDPRVARGLGFFEISYRKIYKGSWIFVFDDTLLARIAPDRTRMARNIFTRSLQLSSREFSPPSSAICFRNKTRPAARSREELNAATPSGH